ncbi:hypothetical protein HCN44_004083 [Aphidius gifuensis]|uniref:RING-type domain-containing protein n=1 Tax=Aphidius gifuensis TaxID=684658 RepID=A0A834XYJ1_APHGI|nr:uncharacterized protein LOC122848334 [Aphidius gifuensis]KAF7994611.1 hypothetical protein HCN44_004083 [Aphidius gifuensis]
MSGIVNGAVGHIVGVGIQVAVGGIPISPNAEKALDLMRNVGLPVPAKNWFTPKNDKKLNSDNKNNVENEILEIYDNAAADIRQVVKCLSPAMAEIKQAIKNRSKSAEPILEKSKSSAVFYSSSQQHVSPCNNNYYYSSQVEREKSMKSYEEKFKPVKKCPVHDQTNESSKQSKEKRNCSKSTTQKICSKVSKQKKLTQVQLKNCSKCGVHVDVVKMLGMLICGHYLCPDCIPKNNFTHCPICKIVLVEKKK